MTQPIAAIAALSLAGAVALAAIGAHAIGSDPAGRRLWDTASFWHVTESLGLLALAALWPRLSPRLALAGALALGIGAAAFCSTLYIQAVTGTAPVAMLAPAGGTLQILGWVLVALACLRGGPNP